MRCLLPGFACLLYLWLPQNLAAQEPLGMPMPVNQQPAMVSAVPVVRLTLMEAKERAIASNKLLGLASMNVKGKEFAIKEMQSNYLPKVGWTGYYMHFDHALGSVLTLRGHPLLGLPPTVLQANVLNEDSAFSTFFAAQPITDLLKVRQGVLIAKADQQIAQAEWEKGVRAVLIGVEQLYWGWLATQKIRAGAVEGLKGAEVMARMGTPEVQIALVEAKQGLQEVDNQLADIEEQLRNLLDLPPCTKIELAEPPLPELGVTCADQVAAVAVANSPEVRSAEDDVAKARAATAAAKVDWLPNIAAIGGYANQTFADYIQPNFAYVGFAGSYTLIDWGKRRNTIRERENMIAMAQLKVQQTQDEVRQKAQKAFREWQQDYQILQTAMDAAKANKEAVKKATTPEAMRDPTALINATKSLGLAEVALVKAEMNYRVAAAQILNMMGH
jgi:outer membrane protein TolC